MTGLKEIGGIQVGVAEELESTAMILVRAGLGNHIDLAAAVITVFRVEVVGQYPELGDRIKVGNGSRSREARFLHRHPVRLNPLLDRTGARPSCLFFGKRRLDIRLLKRPVAPDETLLLLSAFSSGKSFCQALSIYELNRLQ